VPAAEPLSGGPLCGLMDCLILRKAGRILACCCRHQWGEKDRLRPCVGLIVDIAEGSGEEKIGNNMETMFWTPWSPWAQVSEFQPIRRQEILLPSLLPTVER
jgi:hypothetical protein